MIMLQVKTGSEYHSGEESRSFSRLDPELIKQVLLMGIELRPGNI